MTRSTGQDTTAAGLQAAIVDAWQARAELHSEANRADSSQNAYRIFHGHHDGLRGLNIDRLGESCLVSLKQDQGHFLDEIRKGIQACHRFERIVVRMHLRHNANPKPLSVTALSGDLPESPIEVRDSGMRFLVDLTANANPGLFLDARMARHWLLENSRDRRVLNLFAFTGSLGIAAAVGGARSVTHVDSSAAALALVRENHCLNDLPIEGRDLLEGDIYYHLPRAARAGKTFDGIILDPPPMLPRSKRRKPRGQDYPRLARLTTSLLAPGGWLLCFFHRYECSREAYEAEVLSASIHHLQVLWRGTSGDDFPEKDAGQKLRLTVFERPCLGEAGI